MSWAVGETVFPKGTSLDVMKEHISEIAMNERGRMEPVIRPIMLGQKDNVFNSFEEARQFVNRGDYERESALVTFTDISDKASEKIAEKLSPVVSKIRSLKNELAASEKVALAEHKKEMEGIYKAEGFVVCPHCKSRIKATRHINWYLFAGDCLICKGDLKNNKLSATLRKKISVLETKRTEKRQELVSQYRSKGYTVEKYLLKYAIYIG